MPVSTDPEISVETIDRRVLVDELYRLYLGSDPAELASGLADLVVMLRIMIISRKRLKGLLSGH